MQNRAPHEILGISLDEIKEYLNELDHSKVNSAEEVQSLVDAKYAQILTIKLGSRERDPNCDEQEQKTAHEILINSDAKPENIDGKEVLLKNDAALQQLKKYVQEQESLSKEILIIPDEIQAVFNKIYSELSIEDENKFRYASSIRQMYFEKLTVRQLIEKIKKEIIPEINTNSLFEIINDNIKTNSTINWEEIKVKLDGIDPFKLLDINLETIGDVTADNNAYTDFLSNKYQTVYTKASREEREKINLAKLYIQAIPQFNTLAPLKYDYSIFKRCEAITAKIEHQLNHDSLSSCLELMESLNDSLNLLSNDKKDEFIESRFKNVFDILIRLRNSFNNWILSLGSYDIETKKLSNGDTLENVMLAIDSNLVQIKIFNAILDRLPNSKNERIVALPIDSLQSLAEEIQKAEEIQELATINLLSGNATETQAEVLPAVSLQNVVEKDDQLFEISLGIGDDHTPQQLEILNEDPNKKSQSRIEKFISKYPKITALIIGAVATLILAGLITAAIYAFPLVAAGAAAFVGVIVAKAIAIGVGSSFGLSVVAIGAFAGVTAFFSLVARGVIKMVGLDKKEKTNMLILPPFSSRSFDFSGGSTASTLSSLSPNSSDSSSLEKSIGVLPSSLQPPIPPSPQPPRKSTVAKDTGVADVPSGFYATSPYVDHPINSSDRLSSKISI